MGCPTVTQRVWRNAFVDTSTTRSLATCDPDGLIGNRLLRWQTTAKGCEERCSAGRSWQCDGRFPRGETVQRDARIEDGPGCQDGTQRQGQGSQAELQRESAGGEPPRADREHRGVRGERNGGARC